MKTFINLQIVRMAGSPDSDPRFNILEYGIPKLGNVTLAAALSYIRHRAKLAIKRRRPRRT